MKKLVYQKGILEKSFFSKKSLLSIIEVLNLEKYSIARIALCCLLQFAYEHNADIIKELYEPEILDNIKYLIIEYNSAVQLNILGLYNGDKPLIDILNRCSTSFGSRAFKERLLMPIIDKNEINKRYDDTDALLKDQLFREVNKKLNNIIDLERIKRKMITNKISPSDWCNFKIALDNSIDIIELLSSNNINNSELSIEDINNAINDFVKVLDLEEASKYNTIDKNSIGNFFVEGIYYDIDNYIREYKNSYEKLQSISNTIISFGNNDTTNCKIENNDREGYFITITKKRFENAMKINKTYMSQFDKKALATSTTYKLTSKEINKESDNIIKCNNLIYSIVLKYYTPFVSNYINTYGETIDNLIKYLTRVDIASCNAKNAFEYCYYRPNIKQISNDDDTSYIKATNIRHPIIERINTKIKYVGNDVSLNKDGYLLYGINASGKSCFMKTIGLNIIMAQAGMFVASKNFEYMPYHNIFTRISGMDNIYKGMSSFTVEMTELRNILQRCNKYSIVLGDEICCGTESISAIAIVASALDVLIKNNATFIFATHLHELTDMKLIKEHIQTSKINVKHMHISIDENNNIIYERKMQDGQGSQVYGLEVCK
jgi:DNA mismatch repair protein MutS